MKPEPPETPAAPAKARRGLDLRVLIAGLMGLYGVVLTFLGLTDGPAEIAKANGLRINLWVGIGLLAVALAFAVWTVLRPSAEDDSKAHRPVD
ncbi:hypothetical protein C3486_27730 [Streptomyces sp. Ru73]|uniref:hypothetical protein n=1 Tax=Streptomyces sp. Ru73 TaxID=2080748 RepID=UPI000CDD1A03|nr:hypothetical protein [Streptomyces sp. Ru73]POX37581.1 hypothetical protein C3486_27730 [Streptomyces sp. Ru73]